MNLLRDEEEDPMVGVEESIIHNGYDAYDRTFDQILSFGRELSWMDLPEKTSADVGGKFLMRLSLFEALKTLPHTGKIRKDTEKFINNNQDEIESGNISGDDLKAVFAISTE